MMHFRIRDYASTLFYRLLAPFFGKFGKSVRIVYPLRIVGAKYMELGNNVTIQYGAYLAALPELDSRPLFKVGTGSMIGDYAHIICTRRIEIGEKVLTADRLFISDNRHEYNDVSTPIMDQGLKQLADVSIGDGTWIGENVCISGCSIGKNCVIGSNSVVTKDVGDYCVVAGSPARTIKRYCFERESWMRTDKNGAFLEN